ncbi:peptidoglycan recognition protein family protein [Motilibacter deserti]|uniref:N-acetylmuramoyl-L-alanine amidase n=1 Tax=Motilibacter deserti TaxID=2714956 RepID=A0ABX0GPZ8_9ACTN|nr:peptidoglycan recognition family protein [Motilibacter deserti]NHC12898.1 N-acetylmuramoyl-L-alanine amidase [Motilibacter deserti]
MTTSPPERAAPSRRSVLLAAATLPLAAQLPAAAAPRRPLRVLPRDSWARGLPPRGPLPREAAGDVRFLLVHHTASTNDYGRGDVAPALRSFFRFHTGPDKGWPDLAYNFLVDRFGRVWEGRSGSLAGPVMPSATGGTQGFSQLACYIGDHTSEPPTPAAERAMVSLLAVLADRYALDVPGTARFVSRGSNRWPEGRSVTTPTIAGHRDMSLTTCPGETVYRQLGRYRADVSALRAPARSTASASPSAPAPALARPSAAPEPSGAQPAAPTPASAAAPPEEEDGGLPLGELAVAAGAGTIAVAGAAAVRALRGRRGG